MTYRIHRLRITDYRGVHDLDQTFPPEGALITGSCRTGKTSVLNALSAALAGKDVGPDAIRHGAETAEIFVSLDDLVVRRHIDATGTTVTAKASIPGSKANATIGQKRLHELFPGRLLSPMGLFRAKPADRRAMVMAAVPVAFTEDDLARWVPEEQRATIPPTFYQAWPHMHGLEAVTACHAHFYELRAQANAAAKQAKSRADVLRQQGVDRWGAAPAGPVMPADLVGVDVEGTLKQKRALLASLNARADAANLFSEKSEATRKKIDDHRTTALRLTDQAGPALEGGSALEKTVERLERELCQAEDALKALREHQADRQRAIDLAASLEHTADDLEASLGAGPSAPPPEQLVEAQLAVNDWEISYSLASLVTEAQAAAAEVAKADAEAAALEGRAEALTVTVDFLRTTAPSELLKSAKGIPGLGLDGSELTIDGVHLDALSGAEQLATCIEVCKRATILNGGEGRVLITDGLEALDEKTLEQFIRLATADGWQLIATRVTDGALAIEAIVLEDEAAQ
jgi:hypothetical protein